MKRLPRPRRSLWLVLGLVIGVLATAATMAVAGLQPGGPQLHAELRESDDEHRRRSGVGEELLRRSQRRFGPERGVGHAAEPAEQLCERGAVGRLAGRQLAPCAPERLAPGDRARRRRHDTDHLELRALQQLGLQPDHEWPVRRPHEQRVHREHVPGHTRNGRPREPGRRHGLRDLLDHRPRAMRSMRRRSPTFRTTPQPACRTSTP